MNTIDGPTNLVRQDAILGGLSIGQLQIAEVHVILSICVLPNASPVKICFGHLETVMLTPKGQRDAI